MEKHLLNQNKFDSGVVLMDVEDVKASYFDVMRMAMNLMISKESQPFQQSLDNRLVSGIHEDVWKQTPGKIMFRNGLSWYAIILLPYWRNKNGDYFVERIIPQPKLLEILRDLPVCTGVGVRRDVTGIEEFFYGSPLN